MGQGPSSKWACPRTRILRPWSTASAATPPEPATASGELLAVPDRAPVRRVRTGTAVGRWSLWALPAPALLYVLVVDAAAVLVGGLLAAGARTTATDGHVALLLALGCAVHVEVARGIERRREIAADGRPYVDLKSLWSFAGLLLLPLGPALLLVLFSYAYWWLRVSQRPVPHRWVFSAGTVVLASCAAAGVLRLAPQPEVLTLVGGPIGLLTVTAAAAVRWLVNLALVVGAISLSAPSTSWSARLGSPADTLIGLGGLALGVAVAVLAATAPWIVPALLVPVVGMHRGFLVGQFARAARTDPKTGLATIGHWRERAGEVVDRARRRDQGVGILMIDFDEFKAVNDQFGHLVGDGVLRCAAEALRDEVPTDDAVGRFGGEEFVVCLAAVSPAQVAAVAERLRRRVASCPLPGVEGEHPPLTVSIGAATYPHDALDVDGLLLAADTALLAAKRAGRNRVEFASRP